jgi:hypothetical protein
MDQKLTAVLFRFFALNFFALLVGDAAGGLAGRLAGGLALAAAAVLQAAAEVARDNGINSLHKAPLIEKIIYCLRYHKNICLSNFGKQGGGWSFRNKPKKT